MPPKVTHHPRGIPQSILDDFGEPVPGDSKKWRDYPYGHLTLREATNPPFSNLSDHTFGPGTDPTVVASHFTRLYNLVADPDLDTFPEPKDADIDIGNAEHRFTADILKHCHDGLYNARHKSWLTGEQMYALATRLLHLAQRDRNARMGPGSGRPSNDKTAKWWICPDQAAVIVREEEEKNNSEHQAYLSLLESGRGSSVDSLYTWHFKNALKRFKEATFTVHFLNFEFNHWMIFILHKPQDEKKNWTAFLMNSSRDLAIGVERVRSQSKRSFVKWLQQNSGDSRVHNVAIDGREAPKDAPALVFLDRDVPDQFDSWSCSLHCILNTLAFIRYGCWGWDLIPRMRQQTDEYVLQTIIKMLHNIMGLKLYDNGLEVYGIDYRFEGKGNTSRRREITWYNKDVDEEEFVRKAAEKAAAEEAERRAAEERIWRAAEVAKQAAVKKAAEEAEEAKREADAAEERAARKKAEEDAKRKAAEEAKKEAEEAKKEADAAEKAAAEVAGKNAEAAAQKKAVEEAKKVAEEAKKKLEAAKKAEDDAKKAAKDEEKAKKAAEDAKKKADAAKKKADAAKNPNTEPTGGPGEPGDPDDPGTPGGGGGGGRGDWRNLSQKKNPYYLNLGGDRIIKVLRDARQPVLSVEKDVPSRAPGGMGAGTLYKLFDRLLDLSEVELFPTEIHSKLPPNTYPGINRMSKDTLSAFRHYEQALRDIRNGLPIRRKGIVPLALRQLAALQAYTSGELGSYSSGKWFVLPSPYILVVGEDAREMVRLGESTDREDGFYHSRSRHRARFNQAERTIHFVYWKKTKHWAVMVRYRDGGRIFIDSDFTFEDQELRTRLEEADKALTDWSAHNDLEPDIGACMLIKSRPSASESHWDSGLFALLNIVSRIHYRVFGWHQLPLQAYPEHTSIAVRRCQIKALHNLVGLQMNEGIDDEAAYKSPTKPRFEYVTHPQHPKQRWDGRNERDNAIALLRPPVASGRVVIPQTSPEPDTEQAQPPSRKRFSDAGSQTEGPPAKKSKQSTREQEIGAGEGHGPDGNAPSPETARSGAEGLGPRQSDGAGDTRPTLAECEEQNAELLQERLRLLEIIVGDEQEISRLDAVNHALRTEVSGLQAALERENINVLDAGWATDRTNEILKNTRAKAVKAVTPFEIWRDRNWGRPEPEFRKVAKAKRKAQNREEKGDYILLFEQGFGDVLDKLLAIDDCDTLRAYLRDFRNEVTKAEQPTVADDEVFGGPKPAKPESKPESKPQKQPDGSYYATHPGTTSQTIPGSNLRPGPAAGTPRDPSRTAPPPVPLFRSNLPTGPPSFLRTRPTTSRTIPGSNLRPEPATGSPRNSPRTAPPPVPAFGSNPPTDTNSDREGSPDSFTESPSKRRRQSSGGAAKRARIVGYGDETLRGGAWLRGGARLRGGLPVDNITESDYRFNWRARRLRELKAWLEGRARGHERAGQQAAADHDREQAGYITPLQNAWIAWARSCDDLLERAEQSGYTGIHKRPEWFPDDMHHDFDVAAVDEDTLECLETYVELYNKRYAGLFRVTGGQKGIAKWVANTRAHGAAGVGGSMTRASTAGTPQSRPGTVASSGTLGRSVFSTPEGNQPGVGILKPHTLLSPVGGNPPGPGILKKPLAPVSTPVGGTATIKSPVQLYSPNAVPPPQKDPSKRRTAGARPNPPARPRSPPTRKVPLFTSSSEASEDEEGNPGSPRPKKTPVGSTSGSSLSSMSVRPRPRTGPQSEGTRAGVTPQGVRFSEEVQVKVYDPPSSPVVPPSSPGVYERFSDIEEEEEQDKGNLKRRGDEAGGVGREESKRVKPIVEEESEESEEL